MDQIILDISQVDLKEIRFPIWVAYRKPLDYRTKCTARLFDVDKPTNVLMVWDTETELIDYFKNTGLTYIAPMLTDLVNLIGTWM